MLTHMRGKVADTRRAYGLMAEHDLMVVEDCAHALGIQCPARPLHGPRACFSTQSAKLIKEAGMAAGVRGSVPRHSSPHSPRSHFGLCALCSVGGGFGGAIILHCES